MPDAVLTERDAEKLAQSVKRDVVNKCPQCGTPYCIGEMKPGTVIEVECRRNKCRDRKGNHTKFVVAILEKPVVQAATT